MTPRSLTRRRLLAGLAATGATLAAGRAAAAAPALAQVHVIKDPDCGCCGAWVEVLEAAGFAVTVEARDPDALAALKAASGITPDLASCHTASVEGYVIEGHVPPADIRRLLGERPEALGLSVPGMPYGAPGMGPEEARDAYDVVLIRRDGSTEIFTRYPAA